MQENAMLSNKYLDFGVDAPRGGRWYNFDPQSYLDCAVAGSLGGWEPGDLSGGQFLPGQVIVIEDNGTIGEANSEDISLPVFEIARLSWNEFRDFLNGGQFYE